MTGPPALMKAVTSAHQFITFTVASSLQRAVAYGLDEESSFYLCGSHVYPLPILFACVCIFLRDSGIFLRDLHGAHITPEHKVIDCQPLHICTAHV